MSNPNRSRSSARCFATLACTLIGVALGAFSPSNASAQEVEVIVIPLSDNADGEAAPDGSGFVLLASSAQLNRYGVVIMADSGVSSAEITVGQDGAFAITAQEGNSGYDLDAPVALNLNGGVAFAFAVKASGSQTFQALGAASSSWLDNYANWFNGTTLGSGWSNAVGGVIQSVVPIGANTSDGAILTGTVIVSIPAGVAILAGGEAIIGVGTFGGGVVAGGGSAVAGTVINATKLAHVFGKAAHNLGGLLAQYGGNQVAAFQAVESAVVAAVNSQGLTGIFTTVVNVGGISITVTGAVVNGVVKIGTFYMSM